MLNTRYRKKNEVFMKKVDQIVAVLLILGAINLGFIGVFDFDPISWLLDYYLDRLVFVLIGLAGIYRIYTCWKTKKL